MAQAQLSLFGQNEAETYHDTSARGFFSLLVQWPTGKRQSSFPLEQMPTVLNAVDHRLDTWLSQAEFMRPNRRVVNLLRIGLLFADLDTYKMPWAQGRKPEELAAAITYFCQSEGIPQPSIMVYSGRGIQAKWLLERPVPRQALPRWNACQTHLINKLAELGADPGAKDASRVLRLVNTVNSKSGAVCRVVHVLEEGGLPIRYNFEYLAEMLLPVARWDIEKQKAERQQARLTVVNGGKVGNLRTFSGRQLAWDRLEDLRKLGQLRGGINEGERMRHLFWRLNFLLLSGATNSAQMYHEAAALFSELDTRWSYRSKELMTLYSKAKSYEAGERVEFGGKSFAPLYTPKNDTLINLFQISQQEQEQLKTIISTDEAQKRRRERDRLRDEERRRAAGQLEREAYEANSLSRQKPWEAMGMSRAKWYRLGKPSPQQNSETSPSPITNGEASAVALQAARCKAV